MKLFSKSVETGPWASVPAAAKAPVEDLIRAMLECEYRREEATDAVLSALSGLSREATLLALAHAKDHGLVRPVADGWRLEPTGRDQAVRIMRAHRLIETKLARETGLPAAEWHQEAHRIEHTLTSQEVDRLADKLGNPRFDPHGDAIPTREGDLPVPDEQALLAWAEQVPGVIAHIEDEPPSLFKQLVKAGLFAGMRLRRLHHKSGGCLISIEGRLATLSPELAAMVRVRSLLPEERDVTEEACRLADIVQGQKAEVLTLLPGCMGSERSRLLDLGFVPGSLVEHTLTNPLLGSAAYSIRGTLIALRRAQADQVLVLKL